MSKTIAQLAHKFSKIVLGQDGYIYTPPTLYCKEGHPQPNPGARACQFGHPIVGIPPLKTPNAFKQSTRKIAQYGVTTQKELWNVADQIWDILPEDYAWSKAPIGAIMKVFENDRWSHYKKVGPDQWRFMNEEDAPVASLDPPIEHIVPKESTLPKRLDVEQAQRRLTNLGYPLNPDGKLGKLTRAGLQWFRDHNSTFANLDDEATIDAILEGQYEEHKVSTPERVMRSDESTWITHPTNIERDDTVPYGPELNPVEPQSGPTWGNSKTSKLANRFSKFLKTSK